MSGAALSPAGTRWRAVVPGLGTRAWRTDEPEAPGFYAVCGIDGDVPHAGRPVVIAIYESLPDDEYSGARLIHASRFDDEAGLRDWYQQSVGHRAEGSSLPELLELVAGSMLLAAFNDEGDNACQGTDSRPL